MAALILVAVGVAAVPTHQRLTSQADDVFSDPIHGHEGAWVDHSSDLKHSFDGKLAGDFTRHHSMRALLPADPALERQTRAQGRIEGYLKKIARDVDALNPAPPRPHGVPLSQGSASFEKRVYELVYERGDVQDGRDYLEVSGFQNDLEVFNGLYGPRAKMKTSGQDPPSDPYCYFQTGPGPGLLFYKGGHQMSAAGGDEEEARRSEEEPGWWAGRWYFVDNRSDSEKHGYLYELEDDGGQGNPGQGRAKPPESDPKEGTPIWTIPEDPRMRPHYHVPEPDEFMVKWHAYIGPV